jgi:tetratricopeptide (TPR) repeat protein
MRVLFCTGSRPGYMLPPLLGDEQVNCGPYFDDDIAPDGRVRSLQTPAGDFDLAAIAAQLPPEQAPDVVACLVDASWCCTPRNLGAFKCPRVVLIADTHHLRSPLIGMMRYVSSEPFHRAVLLYDRHHATLFRSVGLETSWLPGLTFPHADEAVRAARQEARTAQLAFVGQAGKLHPQRMRWLQALGARGVRVHARAATQTEALRVYGGALAGFNASLNGDLNLRVFEILACGAALLSDRLAEEAGLGRIFAEGRELLTYGSEAELVERARDLLAHPREAQAVGAAGAAWFDAHWHAAARREAFRRLVCEGAVPEMFAPSAAETGRVYFNGDVDRTLAATMIYEGVQELHRTRPEVRVRVVDAPEVGALFATLPRVRAVEADEPLVDLAVVGRAALAGFDPGDAERVWCWDAGAEDFAAGALYLPELGFSLASQDVALFCQPELTLADDTTPAAQLAEARNLFRQGNLQGARGLARAVWHADADNIDALALLGEIALREKHGAARAAKLFARALALRPKDRGLELWLAEALRQQGQFAAAEAHFVRVLATQRNSLPALLGLGRARIAQNKTATAEEVLREAARLHPQEAAVAAELARLTKRSGRILESIRWQRRTLGCTKPLPPLRPEGKRRVLFIVQHPSTWTSIASIVAAFRADPGWEATLVALPYNHPYLPDPGARLAIFAFLREEGLPFIPWQEFALEPGCADVAFLQNPYDVTRPPGWRTTELLQVVPRLAYAPYAIEFGGTHEDVAHQFNQPLQNHAWAVFARSEAHRALFARHCAAGAAHVVATGHPKYDLLCALPEPAPDSTWRRFARGRALVLWNPQFDIRPDGSDAGTGYSTFLRWWRVLPEEFARRPELALVIRPHPLFFTTLEARRILSRAEIDDFRARCAQAGNIAFDTSPSYLEVFAAADALVSDGSSFLIEFGLTGKPICYLHNARGPVAHLAYEIDLDFIRDTCRWAERSEELCAFLDGVTRVEGPALAPAAAAAQRRLSANPTGAGRAIKRVIEERLRAESDEGTAARARIEAPPRPAGAAPDETAAVATAVS